MGCGWELTEIREKQKREAAIRAVSTLRYVKILTYHFCKTLKYLTLLKIFTYIFAKRKILTLPCVTFRYVRVENRHYSVSQSVIMH